MCAQLATQDPRALQGRTVLSDRLRYLGRVRFGGVQQQARAGTSVAPPPRSAAAAWEKVDPVVTMSSISSTRRARTRRGRATNTGPTRRAAASSPVWWA